MTAVFPAVADPSFLAAAACAGVLGFAIQRGGTCTVAAIDELLTRHSASRLRALVEASLWVAGGLLLAQALRLLPHVPPGYAVSAATVAGAALIGYGAFVNGACVLGSVARIGSGEWVYLLMPLGFCLGCAVVTGVLAAMGPAPLDDASPLLAASLAGAVAFAVFAGWRLAGPLRSLRALHGGGGRAWAAGAWSPHAATTVIGIGFATLVVLVGPWAYSDVLADAARGSLDGLLPRALLLVALLAGAVAGGASAGPLGPARIAPAQALRCLAGGALMGAGSLLVPGGNDALVLIGMPLARPYAWLAFAVMCATIALAMTAHARLGRRPR